MNPYQIKTTVQQVKLTADTILEILEQADPEVAAPAALAEQVTNLVADLAGHALAAYSAAANKEITIATLEELRPNPEPLTAPTAR